MSEERLKILQMLQDNKITAEEAEALLRQVRDDDERPRYDRPDWERPRYDRTDWERPNNQYRPDYAWVDDLRAVIGDTASSIGDAVRDAINSNGSVFETRREIFTAVPKADGGIRDLGLKARMRR